MLEIRDLTRRIGKKNILDKLSFSVPENAVWGLAGPNGAGKTTLLRAIAGVDEVDGGDILWRGKSLLDRVDVPLDIAALMPDGLTDVFDLSVAEYLDFHARTVFADASERIPAVKKARSLCGVPDEWSPRLLAELSRGMKQRVSLARVLVFSPPVLLFDEPGAGMDPAALAETRALLSKLGGEGHTVVVSSHMLGELSGIVAGVTFISGGKVVESGRKDELFKRYGVSEMEALYLKIMREK